MGEGESLATPPHPLVQREGPCRETSDGEPRETHSGSRPGHLEYTREEGGSGRLVTPTRLSISTTETSLYTEGERKKTPTRHSDLPFILHLLHIGLGIPVVDGLLPPTRPVYSCSISLASVGVSVAGQVCATS